VPFLVAHGAGNDLARLRHAEQLGIRFVEADLRLWRDRVEVRHLKTLGPIPVLWDRWRLASPWAPRLGLPALLAAASPRTELVLDLKGRDRRLASLVLRELLPGRAVTVCARSRDLLEPFAGRDEVRIVYSVGSRRQLRALLADDGDWHGVSIHERLLQPAVAAELKARTSLLLTWPVKAGTRAHELVRMGVDGLITRDLELLRTSTS
jgi:hypothetical protein